MMMFNNAGTLTFLFWHKKFLLNFKYDSDNINWLFNYHNNNNTSMYNDTSKSPIFPFHVSSKKHQSNNYLWPETATCSDSST